MYDRFLDWYILVHNIRLIFEIAKIFYPNLFSMKSWGNEQVQRLFLALQSRPGLR